VGVLTEKERRIIAAEPKSKTSWAAITIVLLHQIEGEINRLQIERKRKLTELRGRKLALEEERHQDGGAPYLW